ncbi:hypothetical protein P9112_001614 [Eukaryota sp. TZLM1-RC]
MKCERCNEQRAIMKRPVNQKPVCKECFYYEFETDVHDTIISNSLFKPGENVALCVSGGKDSACLAEVVTLLNKRYSYNINLHLLCIDEGILGYRDLSLECVDKLQRRLDLPLVVLSFADLFGFSLDEAISVSGHSKSCTVCGTLRRRSLSIGGKKLNADKLVLGHNADDAAETVLLNLIRGDALKLVNNGAFTRADNDIPRVRPFNYSFQKEIVLYCHLKKLPYFSTECLYAHSALRGSVRKAILALSRQESRAPLNIIDSAKSFELKDKPKVQAREGFCEVCGSSSIHAKCQSCESNFYLIQLQIQLDHLPSDIWIQCFPQNVQEIPNRSLLNLRFCLKKLQHHLVKLFESLDYEVRLGLAKTENSTFGNFLKDVRNSSVAALVTQIPSVYGLLLKHSECLLNMRFHCFLWSNNLPNHLICKCG